MINKNFKRIFNKYSNIFKFIFYLKYLFFIFFISLLTYLVVPKFFNFSENQFYIKKHLEQNYDLTIKNIEWLMKKKKVYFREQVILIQI